MAGPRAAGRWLLALALALGCGAKGAHDGAREDAPARRPGAACRADARGDAWAEGALDAVDTGECEQVLLGMLALAEVREPERMLPCIDAAAATLRARPAAGEGAGDGELADLAVIETTQRMVERLGPRRAAERLAPMLDAAKSGAVRTVAARVVATEAVDPAAVSAPLGLALARAEEGSAEFVALFEAVWVTGFASTEARSAFEARVRAALAEPGAHRATMDALARASRQPPSEVRRFLLGTLDASSRERDRAACAERTAWLTRVVLADATREQKAAVATCLREGGRTPEAVTAEQFARLSELHELAPSNIARCTALDAWPRLVGVFDRPGLAGLQALARCPFWGAVQPPPDDPGAPSTPRLRCVGGGPPDLCAGLSLYLVGKPEALPRADVRPDSPLAFALLERVEEPGACDPAGAPVARAIPLTVSVVTRALLADQPCLARRRADEVAEVACASVGAAGGAVPAEAFGMLSRHRRLPLPASPACRAVAPAAAAALAARHGERPPAPASGRPHAWRAQWPILRTLRLAAVDDPDRLALSLLNASITADEATVAPGLRFAARVLHRDRARVAPLLAAFRNGALDATGSDELPALARLDGLAWLLRTRARGAPDPLPSPGGDRLSAQACNAFSALFNDVAWTPDDLARLDRYASALRASACSNPAQRARTVLGVRPALVRQRYLRARLPLLVASAFGAFALAWLALLAVWSRAGVGAALLWRPLARRLLGLGLVTPALTRVPALTALLLRPLRAQLTRGADLDLFQADTFFRDLPLQATDASGRAAAVTLDALAGMPAGRAVVEAPSGAGKTMMLRWLLRARAARPAVFLRARECAEGVVAAVVACVDERCRDARLFDALARVGRIDVYVDGLNEADAEARARVIDFVQANPRASVVVASQPFDHPVKRAVRVVQIGPLDEARVRAFLDLQAAALCDSDDARARYRLACKGHVDRAVADATQRSAPLPLRDVLPDNGWELGVLAQLLARGEEPDVGDLEEHLHDRVLADFRRASADAGDPGAFPEADLADRALAALEGDRDALAPPDDADARATWARAVTCLASLRLVVQPEGARPRFRHEQVAAFYAAYRFLPGRSPGARERWRRHLAQTQFRSVYLALARRLPLRDALALGRAIQADAAERSDPLLAGEYVRRLERRRARWDVCLLHDEGDADFAWGLHDALRAGLRVFLEARRVHDPARRAEAVARAVEASRLVAVVVSPASRTSFFARSEIAEALRAMREDPSSRRVAAVFRGREGVDLTRIPSELLGVRAVEEAAPDAVARALTAALPGDGDDDRTPGRYDRTHLHRALCAMVQGQFYAAVARCGVDPSRVPGPAAPQATAAHELLVVVEAHGEEAVERLARAIDEVLAGGAATPAAAAPASRG